MALEKSKSIEVGLQTLTTIDPEEDESTAPRPSLLQRIRVVAANITVEPIMVCYVLPSVMASLATQNLSLEKACRVNLALSDSVCNAIAARQQESYDRNDEVAVQQLVATANAWKNVIQSVIPSILLLYLGSWSDRTRRRKPCVLIPIVGECVSCTGFLLCTYFFYQLPMEYNVFFESVPPAVAGGWFAMFMGVFSYVSALSSVETRTIRIGAVNMFSNVSVTIGIALSGILYKQIGFYGVFGTALTMYAASLTYGVLAVKEAPTEEAAKNEIVEKKKGFIRDFFDSKHVKDTFKVAFRNGPRKRKARICLIMVLVMVVIGPMHGEMSVMYLFVRYKFGWDEIDYSLYSTFQFIFNMLGTLFSLMFFSKFLKLDDTILGVISSTSKILASIVYTFAPNTTVFYIAALVEMLNGTSFIAMRSIVSKLVPSEELGKINSLFGVSEALMPLVYGPMYSMVYKGTINILPGAFFLLGGVLTAPAIIIFLWLYRQQKIDLEENEKENALLSSKVNDEDVVEKG